MSVLIKRVYEAPSPHDGKRVLIDRLWPRGVSKQAGGIDLWLKEIAPSTALRQWFQHDPAKWSAFQQRYLQELHESDGLDTLKTLARQQTVTLLYAARETQYNHAVVLQRLLASEAS